jgi:hypothetical protein
MVGRTSGRIVITALLLAASLPLAAASRSRTATATVSVAALAKLSLSASVLSFPDADPGTTPTVSAAGGPVTIVTKVRTSPGSQVSLSVQASDDLRSGTSTIPISALRWTASGAGFSAGTMSTTVAQSVGSWVGSGSRSGAQTYTLLNSWNYNTGSYSTSLVYTLTAP